MAKYPIKKLQDLAVEINVEKQINRNFDAASSARSQLEQMTRKIAETKFAKGDTMAIRELSSRLSGGIEDGYIELRSNNEFNSDVNYYAVEAGDSHNARVRGDTSYDFSAQAQRNVDSFRRSQANNRNRAGAY